MRPEPEETMWEYRAPITRMYCTNESVLQSLDFRLVLEQKPLGACLITDKSGSLITKPKAESRTWNSLDAREPRFFEARAADSSRNPRFLKADCRTVGNEAQL
jgi:hypothetical protein